MARAVGARSQLLAAFEADYGVAPGSGFTRLPFATSSLGSEQPLLASELLGYGRDPLAPVLDAVTVDGEITVPIDAEAFGFWLRAALGDAASVTVRPAGMHVGFTANPKPGDILILNGKNWTFVEDTPSSNETEIQGDIAATVAQLKTDLTASIDADITEASYHVIQGEKLGIVHKTPGPEGNAFTVATTSPGISIPSPTLRSGSYVHEFHSGSWELPSLSLEIGLPEVPRHAMYSGVMVDQISWTMQRSGLLTASVQLVAQGEDVTAASQADEPADLELVRFGHFNGRIRHRFQDLGDVVSAQVIYANNLDRIETIRSDGKIDGADPGVASLSGTLEMRFADQTMYDLAVKGEPGNLLLAYSIGQPSPQSDYEFFIQAGRVHLARPRLRIEGPQGIQATFDWQAALDPVTGRMATFGLQNHIASYAP